MTRRAGSSRVGNRRAPSRRDALRARSRLGAYAIVRRAAALIAFASSTILHAPLAAAESEDQVKAAFLFNFARYVEWPDGAFSSPTAAIRICLIGDVVFKDRLSQAVAGRTVGTRPVEVVEIDAVEKASGCHLLFLAAGVGTSGRAIAESTGHLPVFTISDHAGFAAAGGIANFVLVEQKIRFEINQNAAKVAGLRISSSLLRLAKLVGDGGR